MYEILGIIVLKLDRIGPGFGRGLDRIFRQIDVTVVVDTDLGDNEAGLVITDKSISYQDFFHTCNRFRAKLDLS
jgi:hypothetical protein